MLSRYYQDQITITKGNKRATKQVKCSDLHSLHSGHCSERPEAPERSQDAEAGQIAGAHHRGGNVQ